ncbi:DNA mismatch repair protein MutS [Liberibacter crescens BT-1]|uniref:DNA mismatch repair protein MutS n=1 Tax=Liberibacter crescens (strain BT-1) TaxID=1215343 RepID=L0EWR5_LIBCB|nr:DNA mismatch repair protein MutS [Liberibacter crescens]AGA65305.1 DNA mismatch repair protein MutS [Liberibacter crescens BT-1]AMC13237.1 DNA mismatch repair protein MutS [Liberibacter crescens]
MYETHPLLENSSKTKSLYSEESRVSATPMIQQYIEIKSANPDSLLFYRMGEFYELFFDDALEASRSLGIALTKRGQHLGQDIPMCGVPVHTADDYLQKLITLGYRVAVCEQTEDPAEAKKRGAKSVVRRDVVRLVTPGTLTEEKLLSPADSNYLMALARVRGNWAISWIDISTGIFRLSETSRENLLADISRNDPHEIIVSDTLFSIAELKPIFDTLGRIVVPQPAVFFDSALAQDRIASYYGVKTLDSFGVFSIAEITAAAAAIAYIEKTQISRRPVLKKPEHQKSSSTLFIDPATRTNLELTRTLSGSRDGSLLKTINFCITGSGSRLLAERLASPLTDPKEIDIRLDSIEFFLNNPLIIPKLQEILSSSSDIARALSRLALGRGGPRDIGTIRTGIHSGKATAHLLNGIKIPNELQNAIHTLEMLPSSLEMSLSTMMADDLPLLKRDGGFIRDGADPDLDQARLLRDTSRRIIASLQLQYIEETAIKSLKIKYNNVLGYFIEITSNHSETLTATKEAKARFIHRQTMANVMRFTTLELADLESQIANAADRALSIELETFETLSQSIVDNADILTEAAYALSVIDVSIALAQLSKEQNYCRPMIDNSKKFIIKDGRHPVIEQKLHCQLSRPFIANDCDLSSSLGEDSSNIWLLTGPNMGGKSTFLRQNALIIIMAQMGSYVPATSAHIGIVDRLFSRVGAADDLARGRSTFMVEMIETATILNQATDRSFVILDEIGRGTSTFDGLSIAWAAIEHLHEINFCRGLLATHFHELTTISEQLSRIKNVTLKVQVSNGDIIFLHEIGPGIANHSYGIQVAKLAGLPLSTIDRAYHILEKLKETYSKIYSGTDFIDDIHLFKYKKLNQKEDESSKILKIIQQLNLDEMTPRDALEMLYKIKTSLK